MMKKLLMASCVLFSFSVAGAAHASTVTGPYVNLGGGYNLVQNDHVHDRLGGVGSTSQLRHGTGFTGFGSVGWGFGNGFRTEVEGVYNYSNINHRGGTAVPGSTRGSDQAYGGFVNVLYDIDLANFGIHAPITPFVGVGAGYLWQHYNPTTTNFANGNVARIGGTNGGFAYQGIVGAAYDIPSVPGLAVTTEYRMIGQTFTDGAYRSISYGSHGAIGSNANMGHRFNHQFILSLRYAFDTAPPPAPQVDAVALLPPAPTPSRTYLVFFDWDSAKLGSRASAIVASAAAASTHVQTTRIDVSGYTDTSAAHPGKRGEAYNLALSERRANAVKAELVKDGVPASEIVVRGYGEAHPLVPTGPNVREPQNRRVEIVLK